MVRKYSNNYSSTLNGAITNVATTITVTSATGLPSIGAGETYRLTIDDGTNVEVVEVTDDASSPTLTVTRGVDGTSGTAFADGTLTELRATAASFEDVLAGDETPALIGPLDMSASGVYASFGGSSTASAYSLNHSGGIPRLSGAANFHWTFTSSALYAQAGTTFNRIEFTNDSNRLKIYTNNSERLSINDSGLQFGAANARVTTILDEDTMSSDSATALATQQSIKAYTDNTFENDARFSAYLSSGQSINDATVTLMQFDTESYDPLGDYDNTTNYRYTPSIEGYYLVLTAVGLTSFADQDYMAVNIRKNGSNISTNYNTLSWASTTALFTQTHRIVYCNGTTDYLDVTCFHNSGASKTTSSGTVVFFEARRIAG